MGTDKLCNAARHVDSRNIWKRVALIDRVNEEMEFRNHITVKVSTIRNGGYGLYADRTFIPGDIISVYLGHKEDINTETSPYAMDYSSVETIDAKTGVVDEGKLFLGCHLVNDKCLMDGKYDKRKHYNAKFVDLLLVATSHIRKHTELLVDYNLKYHK